ncbi:hypothetical protein INT43_005466 [Umbelopsis isabellina]|uniref:Uncharacterized protein n=1 Tax=Mortierella isabellina TaxID=91625 RepID=A0A8H7PLG7_MORIS|nr:hypothetical protein INT43_005466 [Umbelopsis isabellina]
MNPNDQINTVWRVCDNNPEGVCHCDWRLTINNCAEEKVMRIIYIINVALSSLTVIFGKCYYDYDIPYIIVRDEYQANSIIQHAIVFSGFYMLGKRIIFQGHSLFGRGDSARKGIFRPKPVECLLLMITIFSVLRLVSSLVLVLDIAPTNMIFRSFIFEIPWQWGYGGFVLYLIGIAQTLAESHKAIATGWLPSPILVDIIGFTQLLFPFVVNNTCSIIAGAMLNAGNDKVAEIFIRLLYIFWFLEDSVLTLAVVWAGSRLISVLNRHLYQFRVTGDRYTSIKGGIMKIKLIIVIAAIGLSGFAAFLLLYGILRPMIMTSTVGSAVLGGIWTWLGAFMCISCEAAVAIRYVFFPKWPTPKLVFQILQQIRTPEDPAIPATTIPLNTPRIILKAMEEIAPALLLLLH